MEGNNEQIQSLMPLNILSYLHSANMWVCCQSKLFPVKNVFKGFKSHWRYTRTLKNVAPTIKYLLVVDFEATCEEYNKINQEIIEFPCLKVSANTFNVEGKFHEYVRPVVNPELSIFCIELTGILQEMVDQASYFPQVLDRFENWRKAHDLTVSNSIIVTSGDWDLGKMFPAQCNLSKIEISEHYTSWIDLKKLCYRATGEMPKSLIDIIKKCGLHFQGRQHSGIDDCLNIANVVRYLGKEKNLDLSPTSMLKKTPHGVLPTHA